MLREGHARRCSRGNPGGAFGPNLCATVVGLAAHMSRDQVATFIADNFGCPMTAASVEYQLTDSRAARAATCTITCSPPSPQHSTASAPHHCYPPYPDPRNRYF